MDVLEIAKELGKKIQEEEVYINFRISQQNLEADKELQKKIQEFNENKLRINEEMSKSAFNQELINEINDKLRNQYDELMKNNKIIDFNASKQKFDDLILKITTIINKSAEGENPFLVDVDQEISCSGSCSTCSGC